MPQFAMFTVRNERVVINVNDVLFVRDAGTTRNFVFHNGTPNNILVSETIDVVLARLNNATSIQKQKPRAKRT